MDAKTFDEFLDLTLERIREVLASKGAEYVPGEAEVSRFHNFEKAAALNEESIEQALWGFVSKHIVSLSDMVQVDSTEHALAAWDEKIGDVLNYMILLRAMVHHNHNAASIEVHIPGANGLSIGIEGVEGAAPSADQIHKVESMVINHTNDLNLGDIDFAKKAKQNAYGPSPYTQSIR